MSRTAWHNLSACARKSIERKIGKVSCASTALMGLNSEVAELLDAESGKYFLKGRPCDHPEVRNQHREAMINPHIRQISPALLWQIEVCGWSFLIFEYINGRHADYSPGSDDIIDVITIMEKLAGIPRPYSSVVHTEQRWAPYLDNKSELANLMGTNLLHTDYGPMNVLVDDAGTYLIDWSAPTLGPAWIDMVCFAVRLVAAGHTPLEAETWAQTTNIWREVPPGSTYTFSLINARMWHEKAIHRPTSGRILMAESAQKWLLHRSTFCA